MLRQWTKKGLKNRTKSSFCLSLPQLCADLLNNFCALYFTSTLVALSLSLSLVLSELQREKAWSRIHLLPLLLAEGDRDVYRREQAALAREREIMKDVPDWEVSQPSEPSEHT